MLKVGRQEYFTLQFIEMELVLIGMKMELKYPITLDLFLILVIFVITNRVLIFQSDKVGLRCGYMYVDGVVV